MAKRVVFSVCGVVAAAAVVCWVAGVIPANGAADKPVQPARDDARNLVQAGSPSGPDQPTPVPVAPAVKPVVSEDGVSVYFSPGGRCTEAIVSEIGRARQSVYVQSAQFTAKPIARALVTARGRGIDVRVVVDRDKNDDKDSQVDRLVEGGVPTFADARHNTAHNKLLVIDHRLVITGSFNLSPEAESENAENLVFIDGKPRIAAAYEANFRGHLEHSKAYGK